jgi:outer membrane protein TolC
LDKKKTEAASFNMLLNRDLNSEIFIADSLEMETLPVDQSALADSIQIRNPMLAMLNAESRSYDRMERKAGKMSLPMLGVGFEYMFMKERDDIASDMNGMDMVMPMISVSIPVYRKKYNAMRNEARLLREASDQEFVNTRNELQVQYKQLQRDLNDAERRINLYREQTSLARKTTQLLLTEFSTSGAGYEEVLRMQYKALDYEFKNLEALEDYNTSIAMAEKLMNSVKL